MLDLIFTFENFFFFLFEKFKFVLIRSKNNPGALTHAGCFLNSKRIFAFFRNFFKRSEIKIKKELSSLYGGVKKSQGRGHIFANCHALTPVV